MDSANAGVTRFPIAGLGENMPNVMIVGIIIAKQNPHLFSSKQNTNPEPHRAVWNFTIRDSPYDLINSTFWGSKDYISNLADKFHVGDIVDISKPKVYFRETKEQKDNFRPSVTSPFQLSLTEKQSMMVFHDAEDCQEYLPLLHIPTKPPGDYFTLADVYHNGNNLRGEFVNLLVAVRDIGTIKIIQAKDGRDIKCRDVLTFDQTNNGLPVTLWNSETIDRAENWRSRETVLFFADVRVDWNAYRRGMVATEVFCTIVTENPDIAEAETLRSYARTAPIKASAILAQLASSIPDPNTINNVMTVQQVLDRASAGSMDNSGGDDSQFTALLYVLLTHYDLDGCSHLTSRKCSKCQMPVNDICMNPECPVGSGADIPSCDLSFDMRVKLSDHTGSLKSVRLSGIAAERIVGCTIHEFMEMSSDMKTQLKWNLFLERCAARVLVLRPSSSHPSPLISLLSCTVADPADVTAYIPMY